MLFIAYGKRESETEELEQSESITRCLHGFDGPLSVVVC